MLGRILYIEDNPVNMRLIKKMLKIMDYDMVEAYDGLSGISGAERIQPDLILMDINLPDVSGFEITRQIKASPVLNHIPVVALTADPSNYRQCLEAGCDGYLNKPISRAELLRTVRQFIREVV